MEYYSYLKKGDLVYWKYVRDLQDGTYDWIQTLEIIKEDGEIPFECNKVETYIF